MGAANSKDVDPGIITVVPAAGSRGPSPLPHAGTSHSRPSSRLSNSADSPCDPLLHHLQKLKAQGSKLDPALFAALPHRSSSTSSKKSTTQQAPLAAAAAAADPDSLLADIAVAQQLSSDTAVLNDAITALITSYQAWHGEHIQVRTDAHPQHSLNLLTGLLRMVLLTVWKGQGIMKSKAGTDGPGFAWMLSNRPVLHTAVACHLHS